MHSSDNQHDPFGGASPRQDEGVRATSATDGRGAPSWGANDAAADFLGLDQDPSAQTMPMSVEPGAPLDTSNSWLMSLEGAPLDEPASADASADGESAPAAEEVATSSATAPAPKKRSRAPLYAFAATVLLGAGGWYGWNAWQAAQHARTDVPVAVVTTPKPPPKSAPRSTPKPVESKPVAATESAPEPTSSTEPVVPAVEPEPVVASTEPATAPAPTSTDASAEPSFAFGPRDSDARVARFLESRFGIRTDGAREPNTSSSDVAPFAWTSTGADGADAAADTTSTSELAMDPSSATEPARAPRRTVDRPGRSTLRLATAEDLAGVWEGSTIPLDAIDRDARILTPDIGRVRITIHGKEIFEGRLYAVGQKMVWLDTELGRMALVSDQVAKIEHLSSGDGTPTLGSKGSQELAGLPRMRVRALGGMLYGRVIDRDERSVTLITDAGAKITVESTDVEPAPDTHSVIVKGPVPKEPGS